MKDNVERIHFHVKCRGVQGLVFVKITFEMCTTIKNIYFKDVGVGTNTTYANF